MSTRMGGLKDRTLTPSRRQRSGQFRSTDLDDSEDTDDYGSSDGGGVGADEGPPRSSTGRNGDVSGRGQEDSEIGSDDDDDDDDEDDSASEEDSEDEEGSDDEDSEDDYGPAESDFSPSGGPSHSHAGRLPQQHGQDLRGEESDSSDDRPLGQMVQDPKALQRALREEERRRHIESSRSALEKGTSRGTSQKTLKKMAAKASRQREMIKVSQPMQQKGGESETPLDVADLTSRLMRVRTTRKVGDPARPPTSGTDSERPHLADPLSRARSINHPDEAAGLERGKSLRTRPSDGAVQARARAQAQGPLPGAVPPNLPTNAAATVAAAQKAMQNAKANPSSANRAHARAMAAAAAAAMEVLARPQRSATLSGQPTTDAAAAPPHVPGHTGAGLARHRTEIRPGGRTEVRRPSQPSSASANAVPVLKSVPLPVSPDPGAPQRDSDRSIGQPMVGNRPRSRSRVQIPAINTSIVPQLPDRARLASPQLQQSSGQASPIAPNAAAIAAYQAAQTLDSSDHDVSRDSAPTSAALMSDEHESRPSISGSIPPRSSSSATNSPATFAGNLSADSALTPSQRVRHKVFIVNRQRFTTSELPLSSRARELVLDVVEREQVPLDQSKGGWVVFDCSPDFGIERPLREYEMVHEVADTRANVDTDYFLLKRTELSPYLSIRAVPSSSPALAGYVYVQDKKKKWSKRWLELRDHALFHAKTEKGKDEVAICQISNFDVYLVDTSRIKTPKAHAFALRSQDKISMFEKPDQDYIHYFSLSDPAAHRDWVRAIMNARTYILRQERAMLFKPPPIVSPQEGTLSGPEAASTGPIRSTAAANSGGGLSRRNTSRRAGGRGVGHAAANGNGTEAHQGGAGGGSNGVATTLVSIEAPTLISREAFSGPFEKGSLLADIAIKNASEAMRAAVPNTSLALQEARRREEAIERQRRMRAEGQPLVDLTRR